MNHNIKADHSNRPQYSSALFFEYNTQLGPPYRILIDTNFINFAIKNKVDLIKGMMDCLYAKCIPCLTECVQGELEHLGERYRLALKVIKDSRIERLPCMHKGIYADDCLVQRVTQHKCYIVGTNDKDLKRRIRKIPGVPIMSVGQHKNEKIFSEMKRQPQEWESTSWNGEVLLRKGLGGHLKI
ncbi:rRNA-processing protein FCF1 [Portunus trituberculatus]|uniref:rRNA-processing protein FCF1 homolog n=1 Tax=Portunus trituberculatus TaxID=210409 RepID=A0A5B7CRU9_PORTR|nr:rRNA-processing protein FCF1 [Portunus trituberculatus]